ncbi:hypothetical protein niasHS_013559 [Heterodera schachtii]|uniref:Uncharacterized protein n=1 Tax=Heterodera schachtii TaxID=97005 RepID=A0ABD2IAP1_HETSC
MPLEYDSAEIYHQLDSQSQQQQQREQMPMDDGAVTTEAHAQNGTATRITFENFLGQGRVNQLGGVFINGRPLPHEKRVQIVEMARRGIKPCKISRELKVSHGAVSKILNRFHETGSISPGQIGGNPRSRLSIQAVRQHILRLREEKPSLSAGQVEQMLVERGICSRQNVPSASRINRLLKAYKQQQQQQQQKARPKKDGQSVATKGDEGAEKPLSHSIENILGNGGGKKASGNGVCRSVLASSVSSPSSSASSVSSSNNVQIASGSDEENQQQQNSQNGGALTGDGRRARTSFSTQQINFLEKVFEKSKYPNQQQKEWLIKMTRLDEDKIITWFSNRRARNRRKAFQQHHHPSPQQMLALSAPNSALTPPINNNNNNLGVNSPVATNQNFSTVCPPALFPFPSAFFPALFAPSAAFPPFGGLLAMNGASAEMQMNSNGPNQKMCGTNDGRKEIN